MSQNTTDVVIVGAGPYGLSLASHLSERRIERRIFGYPMRSWRQMPPGMNLKSFGFATSIPTSERHCTLPEYCRTRGLEDFEPIPTSTFADYGDWFQQQFVPDVQQTHVTAITQVEGGFDVALETGERIRARRVVAAPGLSYFTRIPEVLKQLPPDRVTHASGTSAYLKTGQYVGKDVTVIGAGQSALEAAALLREGGADVRILARRQVWWSDPFSARSLRNRLLNPNTVVGPGRKNWLLQHLPSVPYYLPEERRVRLARTYLGPMGAWWLRDRVEGKVPIFTQTSIASAELRNNRIALGLTGNGGERRIETDHIISATGYEPDVDRLPFIDRELARRLRRIERAPALSPNFESSVPGLYFVGPMTLFNFGPLVRFVAGAPFTTKKVVRHVARSLRA